MLARQSASPAHSGQPDYSLWSIEELWELAAQLRVAGARAKGRRELIELFSAPAATPVCERRVERKN